RLLIYKNPSDNGKTPQLQRLPTLKDWKGFSEARAGYLSGTVPSMSKVDPSHSLGLDPYNVEDMKVTIAEVADFINAERLGAGMAPCKTIIVIGSDTPYSNLGELTDVEFN